MTFLEIYVALGSAWAGGAAYRQIKGIVTLTADPSLRADLRKREQDALNTISVQMAQMPAIAPIALALFLSWHFITDTALWPFRIIKYIRDRRPTK